MGPSVKSMLLTYLHQSHTCLTT